MSEKKADFMNEAKRRMDPVTITIEQNPSIGYWKAMYKAEVKLRKNLERLHEKFVADVMAMYSTAHDPVGANEMYGPDVDGVG